MMNIEKCSTRQEAGRRVGTVGILVNAVLFAAKCAMGLVGNSITVLADAFNNLTDCVSSITVLVGFKMCEKPADIRHPNGHGRMEYICGFLVSLFMIATALSFGKKAVLRIAQPLVPQMPAGLIWIPLAAILMKLILALYTFVVNREIGSATLKAMFMDSISDAVLTGMTILSLLLAPFTALPLDGIFSLLISGIILWSGITAFSEHLDLLLGSDEDGKLQGKAAEIILSKNNVFRNVLSVTIYDYGPEKKYALIQVALNQDLPQQFLQDEIRKMIQELKQAVNMDATIYWETKIGEPYEMLLPSGEESHMLAAAK